MLKLKILSVINIIGTSKLSDNSAIPSIHSNGNTPQLAKYQSHYEEKHDLRR